jgi:iron complex outermembrane receptor protein
LTPRLTLAAGGRVDSSKSSADSAKASTDLYFAYHGTRSIEATETLLSGKLRVAYVIASGLSLSAGVGHVAHVAEPTERYDSLRRMGADWVGNPELTPSRNTALEVDARPGPAGAPPFGGSFFASRIDPEARSYRNVDATLWGRRAGRGVVRHRASLPLG